VLKEYGYLDSKPTSSPIANRDLLSYKGEVDYKAITYYLSIISKLNFLATYTRLDLAYTISKLARFSYNPSPNYI